MTMKRVLVLPVLVLGLGPAGDDLATRYESGKAVRIETRMAFELELVEMTRNGQPVERAVGTGVSETLESVVVDRWVECANGRPSRVVRTFEEVGGTAELDFGEESREQEIESAFEGVVVELARDEEGEVEREVVEGEAPEDEALERLSLELDLDALLPEAAVEPGESWDLGADAIRRALGFELDEALFPRASSEGADGRPGAQGGGSQRPLADAEWSGTAKYSGIEEHEGEECYVVELALAGTREIDEGRTRGTFEAKLTGKLWVGGEERRPVALEVEGTLTAESDTQRDRRDEPIAIHRYSAGTFEESVSLTQATFEAK
jgi:hypothetical protein